MRAARAERMKNSKCRCVSEESSATGTAGDVSVEGGVDQGSSV